jgi:tRNA(Ile)-lysidine synthase
MDDLLKQIEPKAIELFAAKSTILVAVSGGIDSMVLLHSLYALSGKYSWRIAVAHFNHGLRGPESDADQCLVSKFSEQLKLKFSLGEWIKDPKPIKEHGLEMAARERRYKFLGKAAIKHRCNYIATAHHADDQAETFLWRMMRGSGGEGLGGMRMLSHLTRKPRIRLARPLILVNRSSIKEYADDNAVPFREDSSNSNPIFLRNKIRRKLIPYLKENFSSEIQTSIRQSQNLVSTDSDYVKQSAREWIDSDRQTPFSILHVAVQRWVIWHQLIELGVDPQFHQIESLRTSPNQLVSLNPIEQIVCDCNGIIHLQPIKPLAFSKKQKAIKIGPQWAKHEFSNLAISCRTTQKRPSDFDGELFDADKLSKKIILRHWKPGDRFQPIGCNFDSKLQDIYTNSKVGAAEKRTRILACNDSGIPFWVQGLRIGEMAKITPNTKRYLSWKWILI